MENLTKVPKNIGKGEGGGSLPYLYEIFQEIDEQLSDAGGETPSASDISVSVDGLDADNVEDALSELVGMIDGGGDD